MAYTTGGGRTHFACGNLLTADVNAGTVIVGPRTGKSICVTGGHMVARGGAAATCTSVDFKDTANTVAVAFAQASLTQNTRLDARAAAGTTLTTFQQPLGLGLGLKIDNTGSSLATATSVDYYVEYIFV